MLNGGQRGDALPLLVAEGSHFVGSNLPIDSFDGGRMRRHEPLSMPLLLVSCLSVGFVLGCVSARLSGYFLKDLFSVSAWMYGALAQLCLFAILFSIVAAVLDTYGVDYVSLLNLNAVSTDGPNGALRMAVWPSVVLALSVGGYLAFTEHDGWTGKHLYPSTLFVLGAYAGVLVIGFVPCGGALCAHRARKAFLRRLGEVLAAPLFGVRFDHVVLADAMTSACLMLYDFAFFGCFVAKGDFLREHAHEVTCTRDAAQPVVKAVMYGLPFYLRLVQCLYGAWVAERGSRARFLSFVNAGKYLSAISVVVTGSLDGSSDVHDWRPVRFAWLACLVVKTTYCYVWDIVMDWGLARKGSRNWMLRDTLLYPSRWLYYQAVVTNFFARIAWSLAISPRQCPNDWKLGLACLEILRRGQWMVFRIENEDVTRSKKTRAINQH